MEVAEEALASTSGAPSSTSAAQQRSPLVEQAAALLHKRCRVRGVHRDAPQRRPQSHSCACAHAADRCRPHRLLPPAACLQVHVKDGRVLVGDFNCLDKQGNMILTNTYEVMQLNGR